MYSIYEILVVTDVQYNLNFTQRFYILEDLPWHDQLYIFAVKSRIRSIICWPSNIFMIVKKVWTVFYIDNLWWLVWIYIEVIWSNYRVVNIIIQVLQGNLIKNFNIVWLLRNCTCRQLDACSTYSVNHFTIRQKLCILGSNLEIYSM